MTAADPRPHDPHMRMRNEGSPRPDPLCSVVCWIRYLRSRAVVGAAYRLSVASDGAVTVERAGKRAVYQPHFTVIRAETDPKLGLSGFASTPGESLEGVNVENYPLPNWRAANGNGMTDVVYEAGSVTDVRGTDSRALGEGGVAWTFASNPNFTLEAEVRPVPGERRASPGSSPRARRVGTRSDTRAGRPAIRPALMASCSR